MYGLRVYITTDDIMRKLSNEDRRRFNQCVFTNVTRPADGTITIDCVLFNDSDSYVDMNRRQRLFAEESLEIDV